MHERLLEARELCVQCGTSNARPALVGANSSALNASTELLNSDNATYAPAAHIALSADDDPVYIYENVGAFIMLILALIPLVSGTVLWCYAARQRQFGRTHILWGMIDIRLPQTSVAPATPSRAQQQKQLE